MVEAICDIRYFKLYSTLYFIYILQFRRMFILQSVPRLPVVIVFQFLCLVLLITVFPISICAFLLFQIYLLLFFKSGISNLFYSFCLNENVLSSNYFNQSFSLFHSTNTMTFFLLTYYLLFCLILISFWFYIKLLLFPFLFDCFQQDIICSMLTSFCFT